MYWPLLNMYSENFGFGLGCFIMKRTFNNRMKGLILLRGLIKYTYGLVITTLGIQVAPLGMSTVLTSPITRVSLQSLGSGSLSVNCSEHRSHRMSVSGNWVVLSGEVP